jgi:hypothetical protein
MTTEEIERVDAGTKKNYRIVYRNKTYKNGERELQSCILLPSGHPLFGVVEDAEELHSRFPLALIEAGHGSRFGSEMLESWWLVFGNQARTGEGFTSLPLEDLKGLAVPQIIAELKAAETDPKRFSSRPRKAVEAEA